MRNAGRSARAAHLSHGRRVGQPGGLDDDVVEGRGTLHPLAQDAHEVAPHCAADAAVVHLDHVLPGLHRQQRIVNSNLAPPQRAARLRLRSALAHALLGLTSPNSFSMTAILRPCSDEVRMVLMNVVLPLPRKPVTICAVQGARSSLLARAGGAASAGLPQRA